MQIIKKLKLRLKYMLDKNIELGKRVNLNSHTVLEGNNVIGNKVDISSSYIGRGTYVSSDSTLVHSKIGRFCSIAPSVKVCIGSHPTRNFVSTHPSFFSTRKQSGFTFVKENKFEEFKWVSKEYAIEIGNDVWIGSDVLILEGVKIGDGAIIGAGSVVSKDIEPYSISVGNPIKEIRKRFDPEQIKKLLEFKWWDKDIEWLRANVSLFEDITTFLTALSK